MSKFKNFLDDQGRVTTWPSKKSLKIEVIKYMASHFETDKIYTEKEVNAIIDQWHTFGDYFMLRRGMIEFKLLARTRDGAEYWKVVGSEASQQVKQPRE